MQGQGIRGPTTTTSGGTLEVEVDTGGSIAVAFPGRPPTQVPVNGGRAVVPVPNGLSPGSAILIVVLGRTPPAGITVTVVAK